MPALIISMNALKVSEQQQADTQRATRTAERAFVQRVLVQRFLLDAFVDGGTITVTNGNTTPTYVMIVIYTREDDTEVARFAAAACSQVMYDLPPGYLFPPDSVSPAGSRVLVFNPIDQRLWFTAGMEPGPLSAREQAGPVFMSYLADETPSRSRPLPGCA
ncbi:hypothetical protein ABZ917_21905 [Nonomuraea wenchangensis]